MSSSPTPGLALRITVAVDAGRLTPEARDELAGDARLAGEEFLVLVLETRRSRARAVDATDQRRGERAVGVGTNRRVLDDDAGHSRATRLAPVVEIERVIHHDVAALAREAARSSSATGTCTSGDIACGFARRVLDLKVVGDHQGRRS